MANVGWWAPLQLTSSHTYCHATLQGPEGVAVANEAGNVAPLTQA